MYCIRSFARRTPRDRSEGAVADIQISANRASGSWLQSARRSFYSGNGPIGQWTLGRRRHSKPLPSTTTMPGGDALFVLALFGQIRREEKQTMAHTPWSLLQRRTKERKTISATERVGCVWGNTREGTQGIKSHSLRATEERPRMWEKCIFVCLLWITEIKKEIGKIRE